MTIGEAAYLVILASVLADKPAVFMLKMGDPVKINDLARRLIKLSGNNIKENKDDDGIEIIYTGLRPGEKLFEELLVNEDDMKTVHPKIFIDTNRKRISKDKMFKIKENIESLIAQDNKEALKEILADYADYQ